MTKQMIAAGGLVEAKLLRLVLANMLWEGQFYIDGKSTANMIEDLVGKANLEFVEELALRARSEYKLRHVPLLLLRELARKSQLRADVLADVIQRPDEMGEFLAIYNKDKRQPLSNQVKKGLAKAFGKFNEYSLAKWDKNSAKYSMRDVMFMVHPKPADEQRAELYKRIADRKMAVPDTWETQLSAGADKAETFARLMDEKKLGALAFLRNLRNMVQAGVSMDKITRYGSQVNVDRILPFRFLAAARIVGHVPGMTGLLETMMMKALESRPRLKGKTVLLVDVSGSMFGTPVSDKSDLQRFDAAAALALLCREICEDVSIYSFSNKVVKIEPKVRGLSLVGMLSNSQPHAGTAARAAVAEVNRLEKYDRLIVFTDEQSTDGPVMAPRTKGYVINVASYTNGITQSSKWLTISGFSEAVLDYIEAVEQT